MFGLLDICSRDVNDANNHVVIKVYICIWTIMATDSVSIIRHIVIGI